MHFLVNSTNTKNLSYVVEGELITEAYSGGFALVGSILYEKGASSGKWSKYRGALKYVFLKTAYQWENIVKQPEDSDLPDGFIRR